MLQKLSDNIPKLKKYLVAGINVLTISAGLISIAVLQRPVIKNHTQPIIYSTLEPSEIKPVKATYVWKGKPTDPKFISLPSINSDGFMQNVGVDQNKQVGVPNNVHMAGWFSESVEPGVKGLSIVDGHVDGKKDVGIFEKLGKLQKGDKFSVEMGSGQKFNYEVIDVVTINVNDAAAVLFSQNPKVLSQLNLITCGGTFDSKTHAYDKRVIASAKLI